MKISSISLETIKAYPEGTVFIFCCGYESRSSHLYSQINPVLSHAYVYDYCSLNILSYDHNKILYAGAKFYSDYSNLIAAVIDTRADNIVIDVSSLDRFIISEFMYYLHQERISGLTITLCYYTGEYSSQAGPLNDLSIDRIMFTHDDLDLGLEQFAPISSRYSGDLNLNLHLSTCILSVGFELHRGAAALDYLQPDNYLIYSTKSNKGIGELIDRANRTLFEDYHTSVFIDYYLESCRELYLSLQQTLADTTKEFYIIPLGPKIFSAIACHIKCQFELDHVSIWRVQSRKSTPLQVIASEPLYGLRMQSV